MLVLSLVSISTLGYDDEPGASDDSNSQVEDEATTAATPTPGFDISHSRAHIEINYNTQTEPQDCGDYDLRPAMQQRGMPTEQHQGQSGWCYAFVASDLVSYRLGQAVSPADIAINYINRHADAVMGNNTAMAQSFPLGGGFTQQAIEGLNGRGVCRSADFPIDLSAAEPTAAIIEDPVTHARSKENIPMPALNRTGLARFFTDGRINQRMSMITQHSFINALNQLAAHPQCTPQFQNLNLSVKVETWSGAEVRGTPESRIAFNKRVNNWLTQQRMVGISYDQNVLSEGATEEMRTDPNATHISTIVGRRFNAAKSRCEYLVRNSQGSCDYNSDFECANNHIWIPRQVLMWSVGLALSIDN